jgi:hypothetical protein
MMKNSDSAKVVKPIYKTWWFWVVVFLILLAAAYNVLVYIAAGVSVLLVAYIIYERIYFKGAKFSELKNRISKYVEDCNALNTHIEELKTVELSDNRLNAGVANYQDNSKWNFKRSALKEQKYAPNVYNCSREVCDGARREPFKYLCKYFNIAANAETLNQFETVLNNFEAAEDGKKMLTREKENIIASISNDVPFLIKKLSKDKLSKQLGFTPVDLSTSYFPMYTFKYISSGGNASTKCDIVLDIDNLNKFVTFLSEKVKFSKSVAGQRALMTSALRQKIKERDGYTCKHCGASTAKEPNLLLEIDHIVPLSKGGLTSEDNLQTLCWRCNRSKGAKMEF